MASVERRCILDIDRLFNPVFLIVYFLIEHVDNRKNVAIPALGDAARFLRCVLRCQRGFGAILHMPAGFSGGSWPTAGGMGRTSELFQNGPNRKNRAKARIVIELDLDLVLEFELDY